MGGGGVFVHQAAVVVVHECVARVCGCGVGQVQHELPCALTIIMLHPYMLHLQALDNMRDSLQQGTGFLVAKVEAALAEVEDLLSYSNDILCTGK